MGGATNTKGWIGCAEAEYLQPSVSCKEKSLDTGHHVMWRSLLSAALKGIKLPTDKTAHFQSNKARRASKPKAPDTDTHKTTAFLRMLRPFKGTHTSWTFTEKKGLQGKVNQSHTSGQSQGNSTSCHRTGVPAPVHLSHSSEDTVQHTENWLGLRAPCVKWHSKCQALGSGWFMYSSLLPTGVSTIIFPVYRWEKRGSKAVEPRSEFRQVQNLSL